MSRRDFLRLPIVSAGAEYLVMGHLMRRNILAYKTPPHNEGYDLICIHPDPRHFPGPGELAQVRVQVKSRYATDCDRGFPVKEVSLDAFDFLVVAFLNIGKFFGRDDSTTGDQEGFGFVVRTIGYGGLDFKDDRPDTPAESRGTLHPSDQGKG